MRTLRWGATCCAMVLTILAMPQVLWAGGEESTLMAGGDGEEMGMDMAQELSRLKARVNDLEEQLSDRDTEDARWDQEMKARRDAESKLTERLSAVETMRPGAVPTAIGDVHVHGSMDVSYTGNLDDPNNRINRVRAFDVDGNEFNLNLFELNLEKPVDEVSPLGFRTDLGFGEDASLFDSTSAGGVKGVATGIVTDDALAANDNSNDNELAIQQAYAQYLVPLGSGLLVKMGKFVTTLGYEVIESHMNPNWSRGYLFTYAIPFSHVGVMGSYNITEWLSAYLGLVNGWDQFDDVNRTRSLMAGGTVNLADLAAVSGLENALGADLSRLGTVTVNFIGGPENNAADPIHALAAGNTSGNNSKPRNVLDVVYQVQPIENVTLGVNVDAGEEYDGTPAVGGIVGKATWTGYALYGVYDFTDSTSTALRFEAFDDNQGARTGVTQDLQSVTATVNHWLNEKMLARVEYRHDESSRFFAAADTQQDGQNTLSGSLAYVF